MQTTSEHFDIRVRVRALKGKYSKVKASFHLLSFCDVAIEIAQPLGTLFVLTYVVYINHRHFAQSTG